MRVRNSSLYEVRLNGVKLEQFTEADTDGWVDFMSVVDNKTVKKRKLGRVEILELETGTVHR